MKDTLMGGALNGGNFIGGVLSGNSNRSAHQFLPDFFKDDEVILAGGESSGAGMRTGIENENDIKTPIIQIGAPYKLGRLFKRSIKVLENEQTHFALSIMTHYAFILVIGGVSTIHTPNMYIKAIKTPYIR